MNGTNPLIDGTLLHNNNVVTNHHAGKTINRLNRTLAGKFFYVILINSNKNRTNRAIGARRHRITFNRNNMLSRTVNTNLPLLDDHRQRRLSTHRRTRRRA